MQRDSSSGHRPAALGSPGGRDATGFTASASWPGRGCGSGRADADGAVGCANDIQQFERGAVAAGLALPPARSWPWCCSGRVFRDLFTLSRSGPPFQNFTIRRSSTGKALEAAISPDGKYVLNVQDDNGLQSLWLRNVPTGSDTQIVPPASAVYNSLAFSPDGNYVYFRKAGIGTQSEWDLYRTPVLGGTPQMIVRDIDTEIAFSRTAHHTWHLLAPTTPGKSGKWRVVGTNLDGSENIPKLATAWTEFSAASAVSDGKVSPLRLPWVMCSHHQGVRYRHNRQRWRRSDQLITKCVAAGWQMAVPASREKGRVFRLRSACLTRRRCSPLPAFKWISNADSLRGLKPPLPCK